MKYFNLESDQPVLYGCSLDKTVFFAQLLYPEMPVIEQKIRGCYKSLTEGKDKDSCDSDMNSEDLSLCRSQSQDKLLRLSSSEKQS